MTGPPAENLRRGLPRRFSLLALVLFFPWLCGATSVSDLTGYGFPRALYRLADQHWGMSGAYVLDKGDEALLARGWMVNNAVASIDILTFIWSLDNIGLIATDALLRAAERGVRVRVVVDDMVLEEDDLDLLLALDAHPRFEIRIYNPVETVGVSTMEMLRTLITDFRRFNHRLHNKSFLVDRIAGITGGRNVANEYFDYDQKYNFRDRDILVVGPVVEQMQENFERYWDFPLSRPIAELLPERAAAFSEADLRRIYAELREDAARLVDNLPLVSRALEDGERRMAAMLDRLAWTEGVWFVSDRPGKNLGQPGLGGSGTMAEAFADAIAEARERITVQSPYLVLTEDAFGLCRKLEEGVEIRISTNSLASTDNVPSFSGYAAQRSALLEAGFVIREFQPKPDIETELIERYLKPDRKAPIFVLHAKTLIVDGELLYIGTFNLDPRSVSLNSEEGVFVRHAGLAKEVERQIEMEMAPENSWDPALVNPDRQASWWRRIGMWFFRLLPIRALL